MWRIESLCRSALCLCWASSAPDSRVDEGERRHHLVEIELLAPRLDVGLDAAVGDGEGLAVRQQDHLVRTDAVGRQLADAPVAGGRVVDADQPLARIGIVLGRIEQATIAGEHAVTVEVAVRRRREQLGLAPAVDIEGERERARTAGKDDGLAAGAVVGDVVAALFQRVFAQDGAVEREDDDGIGAVGAPAGGDEIARLHRIVRVRLEHAGKAARGRRQGER